ncbi:hypothetical protein ACE1CD_34785 [Aerosakkonema sp. BLCC-F183]|uniref:hypothetical protein n=1 Tax=Aerosakkonema sp. BLCC-F183 TaxID=3342834 RepID=UPI0035B712CF
MTQELIDLRTSILEERYSDALAIVDELEGMSKQAVLRTIKSHLLVLLMHSIKNLTYNHSAKELPALIEAHLAKLPGGEDWRDRRK